MISIFLTLTLPFWITTKMGDYDTSDISMLKIPLTLLMLLAAFEIIIYKE